MQRIMERDTRWFGPEWRESEEFETLETILVPAAGAPANPWQWRLAALLYFVERDVRRRYGAHDGPTIYPHTLGAGATALTSIRTQGQWLSAILLYQLRLAFEALPGMNKGVTLLAAADTKAGIDVGGVSNAFSLPVEVARGDNIGIEGAYPRFVWTSTETSPGARPLPVYEPINVLGPGHWLPSGRLEAFANVFQPSFNGSTPLGTVVPPRNSIGDGYLMSGGIPWSLYNVTHQANLFGIGARPNMPWAPLGVAFAAPGAEQNAFELFSALSTALLVPGAGLFSAEARVSNDHADFPTLYDYTRVCELLDAMRAPVLQELFRAFADPSQPFGFLLPEDKAAMARPDLATWRLLVNEVSTFEAGTIVALLRRFLPEMSRIDPNTATPLLADKKNTAAAPALAAEFDRRRNIVSSWLPDVVLGAFAELAPSPQAPAKRIDLEVAANAILPAATSLLAAATRRYLWPSLVPFRRVRLGATSALPMRIVAEPTLSLTEAVAEAAAPPNEDAAKKKQREEARARTLALNRNIRQHAHYVLRLEQALRPRPGESYLATDGTGSALITSLGGEEWLEHAQDVSPWATLAVLLDLIQWARARPHPLLTPQAFSHDDGFERNVREWSEAVSTVDRSLRERLQGNPSTAALAGARLADLLRIDGTPSAGHMHRIEIAGKARVGLFPSPIDHIGLFHATILCAAAAGRGLCPSQRARAAAVARHAHGRFSHA